MAEEKTFISDRPSQFEERPIEWNSDAIVEQLSRLGLPYIAVVPGSSYRGVHDSLINYNGNRAPEMLLCLHEEHCVALAHGYAKVTEKPMAVALHANVGLMHAVMAIYNAFCDRVPMLILGATGPVAADKKRPWIDWIHTSADQGALVRNFVKWDDQPSSVNAAISSLLHGTALTMQQPRAPIYICFDVELQESKTDLRNLRFPDTSRRLQVAGHGPSIEDVDLIGNLMLQAKKPLFLLGRGSRSQQSWDERITLAEVCGARVITDLKQAAAFPTDHQLHACAPSVFNSPRLCELVREADVILSLDWVDLAGTLAASLERVTEPNAIIVHVSLDTALHNGWSKDHFGHAPVDHAIAADPDKVVSALLPKIEGASQRSSWETFERQRADDSVVDEPGDHILMHHLADALYKAVPASNLCLIRLPLGWKGNDLRVTQPLSYLGQDGGAGLASGPGQAVGSALALKSINSDLLPVAILGDGDYLMGSSALWTAARYRIPLLVLIANNASFFNDEVHQERVATARRRPVENKGIGVRIDDPLPDLSRNAESLGALVVGDGKQVTDRDVLVDVLHEAVRLVREKKTLVVVDIAVRPDGYSETLNKSK